MADTPISRHVETFLEMLAAERGVSVSVERLQLRETADVDSAGDENGE